MGAAELFAKIRADGRDRVAAIDAERDRQVAAVKARQDAAIEVLERESRERIDREAKLIRERARSRARLERRKALLAAQWQAVDRVLAKARDMAVTDPDYPALLKAIATRHRDPASTVRLSRSDTKRFGTSLGVELGEPVGIAGGLQVVTGRQVVDYSLDEAMIALRGEMAPVIVRELFPDFQPASADR